MRLLFYDVETAQSKNIGSICSVGWVLFEDNHILDSGYQLINPNCSFSHVNTGIHGLTKEDVKNAPCFADYWNSTLKNLMTTSIIVAHNAGFDLSATEQALYAAGLDDPGLFYIDSLQLIKHYFQFDSYKLTDLSAMIGYDYDAHNALSDATATSNVLQHLCKSIGLPDLATMIILSPVRCDNTKSNNYKPHSIRINPFPSKAHCTETVNITGDVFSGLKICITGDLPGFSRAELEKIILQNGGQVTSSVSSKTDYLLCCDPLDAPSETFTSKHRAAVKISEDGGKIKIISPDQFFLMVQNQGGNHAEE